MFNLSKFAAPLKLHMYCTGTARLKNRTDSQSSAGTTCSGPVLYTRIDPDPCCEPAEIRLVVRPANWLGNTAVRLWLPASLRDHWPEHCCCIIVHQNDLPLATSAGVIGRHHFLGHSAFTHEQQCAVQPTFVLILGAVTTHLSCRQ